MSHEDILVETRGHVGLITLNRPKALNALNDALMDELDTTLLTLDTDTNIGVIVITGSEKAFAASTDIGAMADYDFVTVYKSEYITRNWETIHRIHKSVIATVVGYTLSGGCGLTVMYDIILAAGAAKLGQPEVKLGTMPGAGGTQRLPRAVSKTKAVDLCLTVRMMGAEEAEHADLILRAVPADKLPDEAIQAAETIAGFSLPTVMMIKKPINTAYETLLSEGIHLGRYLFHSMFATEDQKKDMHAFIGRRVPAFKHQ